MKTITDMIPRPFKHVRFEELPSVVSEYVPDSDHTILVSSDILTAQDLYREAVSSIRFDKVILYYPDADTARLHEFPDFDAFLAYLRGEGFDGTLYVVDAQGTFLCYSSQRHGFGFAVLERRAAASIDTAWWDSAFAAHIASGGVGFGDEGRCFAVSLIQELASSNLPDAQRFRTLLQQLAPVARAVTDAERARKVRPGP